ncbi:hypothetical protein ACOMHN_018170 [Nucella lapillus]
MSSMDLTSPCNVGQRLSGSSSKVSLRDEDMEMLDFNIHDISRASSPASVSAKSEGHLHRERRHRHSVRGDEDYRRRYNKLKSELDAERGKVKAMNREKIEEMRQIREFYENERRQEHAAIQKKFEEEKKREVSRLKGEMIKQKDYELQQVLKYKEDEIKLYRSHTPASSMKTPVSERSRTPAGGPGFETPRSARTLDRPHSPPELKDTVKTLPSTGRHTPGLDTITDEILRANKLGKDPPERAKTPIAPERARTPDRARTPGAGGRMTPMVSREEDRLARNKDPASRLLHLENEISRVRKERDELYTKYKEKCRSEEKKDKDMKVMKEDYENELRRLIGEYKKVALGNLQKLKIAEHALREGSLKEDDVLQISLSNPQNLQIRRLSASSPASLEGGGGGAGGAGAAAAAGTESGSEEGCISDLSEAVSDAL